MITLVLHGRLGEKFAHPVTGERWTLDVQTPAEGLRAIDTMMGGLFDFIYTMEKEMQGYHLQVNGKTIGEDLLGFRFIGDEVSITPLLQGADTKGILQIVAGVALIAIGIAAPYIGGPLAAIAATSYGGLTVGTLAVGLGLSLALGGVARLLVNTPDSSLGGQDSKSRSSYIFSGPVNTIQQGECVPVAYGDVITGSSVVSASVESEDVSN